MVAKSPKLNDDDESSYQKKYILMNGENKDNGKATLAGALPCVLSVKYHNPPMHPKPKAKPSLAKS